MRLTELRQPRVERLAGVDRIVVGSMDKEYRHLNVSHCSEKPRSQLRGSIPAIAGSRKDYHCSQILFFLSLENCQRASRIRSDTIASLRVMIRAVAVLR